MAGGVAVGEGQRGGVGVCCDEGCGGEASRGLGSLGEDGRSGEGSGDDVSNGRAQLNGHSLYPRSHSTVLKKLGELAERSNNAFPMVMELRRVEVWLKEVTDCFPSDVVSMAEQIGDC